MLKTGILKQKTESVIILIELKAVYGLSFMWFHTALCKLSVLCLTDQDMK